MTNSPKVCELTYRIIILKRKCTSSSYRDTQGYTMFTFFRVATTVRYSRNVVTLETQQFTTVSRYREITITVYISAALLFPRFSRRIQIIGRFEARTRKSSGGREPPSPSPLIALQSLLITHAESTERKRKKASNPFTVTVYRACPVL